MDIISNKKGFLLVSYYHYYRNRNNGHRPGKTTQAEGGKGRSIAYPSLSLDSTWPFCHVDNFKAEVIPRARIPGIDGQDPGRSGGKGMTSSAWPPRAFLFFITLKFTLISSAFFSIDGAICYSNPFLVTLFDTFLVYLTLIFSGWLSYPCPYPKVLNFGLA